MPRTILECANALAEGKLTSRALVEEALAKIDAPGGAGALTFTKVYRDAAIAAADASDNLRRHGIVPSLLAGIPVSVKDLFDVKGDVTLAGSKALIGSPPATADAPIVARLRAAGAVLIGRTNLSEFAFSPLGINPHYGTPPNPADNARVPGGSSSGAAVSVANGMAVVGIGSDTAGSCRIPAAFCGTVGYKPTQERVPLTGTWPLSSTLDSVGPFAMHVSCCALTHAALAGAPIIPPTTRSLRSVRLALPTTVVRDDMDAVVSLAFQRAATRLSAAGAQISEIPFPEINTMVGLLGKPFFTQMEAYAWHEKLMAEKGHLYDPRILSRIMGGANATAADYINLLRIRRETIASAAQRTTEFDAILMPTIQHVAPKIADMADEANYWRYVRATIRNPAIANFFDRCAISLPCHGPGELPVGLSLVGDHDGDRALFQVALAVEAALSH